MAIPTIAPVERLEVETGGFTEGVVGLTGAVVVVLPLIKLIVVVSNLIPAVNGFVSRMGMSEEAQRISMNGATEDVGVELLMEYVLMAYPLETLVQLYPPHRIQLL